MLAAPSAHAFSFGGSGATGSEGSAIADPDQQMQSFGGSSALQDLQEGARSVQFGVSRSFGSGPTSSLVPPPGASTSRAWPVASPFPYHQ